LDFGFEKYTIWQPWSHGQIQVFSANVNIFPSWCGVQVVGVVGVGVGVVGVHVVGVVGA
jgi:hypothetical protein